MERIKHAEPGDLLAAPEPTHVKKFIWHKKVKEWLKRSNMREENIQKVYSLVWGQCTEILQAKLGVLKNFKTIKDSYDAVALLKEIKGTTFKFEDERYLQHSIYFAWKNFYMLSQKDMDNNAQYLEQFQNIVDVLEQFRATFGMDKALLKDLG